MWSNGLTYEIQHKINKKKQDGMSTEMTPENANFVG